MKQLMILMMMAIVAQTTLAQMPTTLVCPKQAPMGSLVSAWQLATIIC